MKLSVALLSQSDCTGGKNPVVVEGFHPELIPYLEDSFVIFQRCEDAEDYFTSEEPVLNALKPKLYIADSPSPFDTELCKSFGCEIENVQSFMDKIKLDVEETEVPKDGEFGPEPPTPIKSQDIWSIQLKSPDLNPFGDEGTECHAN